MANSAAMKMIVGSTWKAKIVADCAPSGPSTVVMIFGHACLLPSGPKTNDDPTSANASSLVMPRRAFSNVTRPASVLSTRSAKTTCRPRPQATVRMSIARRLADAR